MINLNNLFNNLNNASSVPGKSVPDSGHPNASNQAEGMESRGVSKDFGQTNISNNNVLAHKIVNQSIYQRLSASFTQSARIDSQIATSNEKLANIDIGQATEASSSESLFDFQAVADSVLGFISSSIAKASERGESEQVLQEMFAGARAGVAMGIERAKESLNSVSAMTNEIEQGIAKSESLISQGIDELEQHYFPDEVKLEQTNDLINSTPLSAPHSASSPSSFLDSANDNDPSFDLDDFNGAAQGVSASRYQSDMYASKDRSSELSITTADGDLVTISFSQLQSYQRLESYNQIDAYATNASNDGQGRSSSYYGQASQHSVQSQYTNEMSFSLSIDGELDDEERAAIEQLIAQVNSLQKEFFDGDIEKAYQQALAIGFDDSQIRAFSLELEQVETYAVQTQYSEVASYSENATNSAAENMKPLLSYIHQLEQNLEQARQLFAKNDAKIHELMDQVFTAEFGDNKAMLERLNSFNERFTEQQ